MSSLEEDEQRPPVYIRDPRTTVEYAQNVRNFKYATAGVVERLSDIFSQENTPSIEEMRAQWTKLNDVIAAKKASYDSLTRVMPKMGPQILAEIQKMQELQGFLELSVNTRELLLQTQYFVRTFQMGADDERMCAECGSSENVTHQSGEDERIVYCKKCVHALHAVEHP